jgi:hypothetical protein
MNLKRGSIYGTKHVIPKHLLREFVSIESFSENRMRIARHVAALYGCSVTDAESSLVKAKVYFDREFSFKDVSATLPVYGLLSEEELLPIKEAGSWREMMVLAGLRTEKTVGEVSVKNGRLLCNVTGNEVNV